MNSSGSHTLQLPDCEIQKETLRGTLSDPDSRSRRARWIKNKILFNNGDKSDSGFQELTSARIPPVNPIRSNHMSYDNLQLRDTWSLETPGSCGSLEPHLKKEFSLPASNQSTLSGRRVGVVQNGDTNTLNRRNGVRYSIKVTRSGSQSPCSISSESETSQGDCENSLDPDPSLLIPDAGRSGRKQSVFSVSYDAWSENSVLSGFRDLSPCRGSILEAAWTGDVKALEKLLEVENTVERIRRHEICDGNGRTALHLSSACGHLGAVELLLKTGVDVNVFDTHQKATPLSCAASCGSVSVLQLLINHGADVNAGYDSGKTALHWAVQAASVDCAKILLEKGALQNPPLIFTETPLHIAASLGDADSAKLLLEHGADAGLCKGTYKSQALHLAAEEGSAACIRLLLEYGAPLNAKDGRGHTALHLAANSDADSVAVLLTKGANPNITDANGRAPLHCAISRGSRAADVVRLLVDNGADIDAQDDFGYAPLHLAAVQDSSQCASILLHHGADVTVKTKAGTSALSLLVRRIPDVMRYLVERLDSAVSIHEFDPADPDCEIRLDFRAIVPNSENKQMKINSNAPVFCNFQKRRKETEFLTCVLAAGNKKILNHPLSEAFLTLKWLRVRKFFWASLLFQIALVLLFTVFVMEVYVVQQRPFNNETTPILSSSGMKRNSRMFNLNNSSLCDPDESNTDPDPEIRTQSQTPRRSGWSWFRITPQRKDDNSETREKYKQNHRNNGSSKLSIFKITLLKKENNTDIRENYRQNKTNNGSILWQKARIKVIGKNDDEDEDEIPLESENDNMEETIGQEQEDCFEEDGIWLTVVWGLLIAFTSLMAIKEIFQFLQAPLSYIFSSENWGQWALIVSVTLTSWCSQDFKVEEWQYPAAACGIFLAWGLMLLQVGRFPALGLYVQMLGKVAANFGVFILAYACLLIAFALAFSVLYGPNHPPYQSLPKTILKVLTMMVGEVDYEDLFYPEDKSKDIQFPITAHIFHGAFVVLCTVVLMNLLVGLAVHDIQGLQKRAKLNRLSRQTALISRLESFIFSKRLQTCLPRSIGTLLQESALLVPSSYKWSYYIRPNDPRDQRLPKDLKMAALKLAAARHASKRATKTRQTAFRSRKVSSSNEIDMKRIEQKLDQLQNQIQSLMVNLAEKFANK